jgi:hypothetical protein
MKNSYLLYFKGKYFPILIIIFSAAISIIGFIIFSKFYYRIGFPLDDAWIHQTYARNLANNGEWAFIPGQTTSGSTSPLWTILLTGGYLLNIQPLYWTFFIGWLVLAGQAYFGEKFFLSITPGWKKSFPWAALFLLGEWHFVWAAASGMETLLLGLISCLVFYLLSKPVPPYLLIGLFCGLSVWVRPDGITLLGPSLLLILLNERSLKIFVQYSTKLFAGFIICFIPYLAFNLLLSGNPWPNTFYAKQAEYFLSLQQPFFNRFFSLLILPAVGAGFLLSPGLFLLSLQKKRNIFYLCLAALIWWFGYTFIYALRLPLPFQHGRYLMPAMPVIFILSGSGLANNISNFGKHHRVLWFIKQVWIIALFAVWVIFYFQGAKSYSQDVAIIESEMVATAKWISSNTEPNNIIAAHDIGALGFYGNRIIIDLAGLISPEVIPFIRDETRLARHLDEKKVDFLMTFPSWFPELTSRRKAVFSTEGTISPSLGGENMNVYPWGRK